jgi:cobalt transport protein
MADSKMIYVAGFAVVFVMCLCIFVFTNGDWGGSDDSGGEAADDYGYEAWLTDWIDAIYGELPGEIESLLFAVQAAIGAIIIGYFIGVNSGKKKALASQQAQ